MKLQKIASFILALTMIFSLGITAFAAEETGSITINGVSSAPVYEVYRLLDLESYDVEAGAYSYKVNAAWTAFFATEEALKYVAIDEAGYVTWNAADDDDTIAKFAKGALSYAKEKGIAPVKSSKNDGEFVITENTGVFSELPLGWYLVDSNVGALCGLTTTNPDASINAKNGAPTIDKQVQEDSTAQWGGENNADIGQIVNFRVTISVHAGAQNYVLHDDFSDGFSFGTSEDGELLYGEVTGIKHVVPSSSGNTDGTEVPAEYYNVVTDCEDGCEFHVEFTKEFCDHLETNDKVVVSYSAMLNRNAVIAGEGNPNEAWLTYGETFSTAHDATTTYTYGFDVVKTDSGNKLIDGAEFRIYDGPDADAKEIGVVLMDDGVTYRRARADEESENICVNIDVNGGKARVVGFDNGTYYIEEKVAPDGYNKLTARQKFIISDANLDAVFNGLIFSTGSGVHVINKTGSMLPETGGMGTTLFYVLGGLLVGGAVVALVSKKRMSVK